MLHIQGATLYTPQRVIDAGAVLTEGRHILAVGQLSDVPCPSGVSSIEAGGLILVPGLIDLQINGAFGHDFTADPASIGPVAAQLPQYGVTAFLPTIITSPQEIVAEARERVTRYAALPGGGAAALGLHVEGPFLHPERKGAHNAAYLRQPDARLVRDWSPQRGVRLVTLAPELPGALEVVHALVAQGVAVSAGHSTATSAQARSGFAAGIRYGTHLFNAMPPMLHRKPGLAGALLTDPRAVAGLIADGVHTHPSMIDLAWRALAPSRISLVTDAMAALGMEPGRHQLGDFEVIVDETSARLADGTLAGSILSLDAALRNLIRFSGCTLREALPAVTATPAALLGIGAERGQIAPGSLADLVLLTPDLQVHTTIIGGEIAYREGQLAPRHQTQSSAL